MNRQAKYLFAVLATLLVINLFVVGCQVDEGGVLRLRLNPETADSLERGSTAALSIAEILAPFLGPVGGIAVGGLASGLALFRKFKPKLTQFQTKAEMSNTVAGCLVTAFEEIKTKHPDTWAKSREQIIMQLEASGIDTKILENAIRGLRGLPAKA